MALTPCGTDEESVHRMPADGTHPKIDISALRQRLLRGMLPLQLLMSALVLRDVVAALRSLNVSALLYIFRRIGRILGASDMGEHADMLRATEAAIVAGVALRDMNRAVDERILPAGFVLQEGGNRHFSPGACVIMAFYATSSRELTAEWRLHIINQAAPRLRHINRRTLRAVVRDDWCMRHDFLTVDLAPFVTCAADRHERLDAAEKLVTSSSDVLGGMPVIRGTRIPVRDVAASVAAGYPRERILEAYPSLNGDQIDLAVLYAQANPTRGRPRASLGFPAGTKVFESIVARRKKAG